MRFGGRIGSAKEIENTTSISARPQIGEDIEARAGAWKQGAESLQSSDGMEMKSLSHNGSEEYIIGKDDRKPEPLKINVTTDYVLEDDKLGSSLQGGKGEDTEPEGGGIGIARTKEKIVRARAEITTHITAGKKKDGLDSSQRANMMLGMSPTP